jgi:hypothetical protein
MAVLLPGRKAYKGYVLPLVSLLQVSVSKKEPNRHIGRTETQLRSDAASILRLLLSWAYALPSVNLAVNDYKLLDSLTSSNFGSQQLLCHNHGLYTAELLRMAHRFRTGLSSLYSPPSGYPRPQEKRYNLGPRICRCVDNVSGI